LGQSLPTAGFMNPAPEQSSPGRIRNPPDKNEKRPHFETHPSGYKHSRHQFFMLK